MKVVEFIIYNTSRSNFLKSNHLKGTISMEENLIYKHEVGGSILSCFDIVMEWWKLVFGDRDSFDHRQRAYGGFFQPSPKYEIVMIKECHNIYTSIVTTIKIQSP